MPKVKTPVQKPKVAQVEQSSTSVDPPEKDAENARPPAPKSITFRSRHSSSMSDHFKKRKTMSMKAGLLLPVSKMLKALKKGKYAPIIQRGAAVYITSVIEYLTAEILEVSSNVARVNKCLRIKPRHINLGILNDEELKDLLKDVTITQGGVMPNIHSALLRKKTAKPVEEKKPRETYSIEKTADTDQTEDGLDTTDE